MIDSRYELIEIFKKHVHPLNFSEYIHNRLAGDFISKLVVLLHNNGVCSGEEDGENCGYRIERRTNNESGHIWLEVLSDCGEDFEFENDRYRYFNFCPYCGRPMQRSPKDEN